MTIVLSMAACCVYFLYRRHKRPLLMALCIMFVVYLADNTIVFCTEIVPEFAGVYNRMFLETPSVKTIYFVTLLGSLLYILHCIIPAFTLRHMGLLTAVYASLLICAPMISKDRWMVFVYYFITQVLVIGISIWGLLALRSSESSFDKGVLRRIFLYFLCMSLLILTEDTLVIFFLDKLSGPWPKINNRNFSENLMYLGLSLPVFRYTLLQASCPDSLANTSEIPDYPVPEPQRDLNDFCRTYKLTEREQEILDLLFQSKSQQAISEELLIAPGTVKTHTHNIYQKTGCTNRSQVITKYQAFCNTRDDSDETLT
ncbi:MAG: helix-turn-helix transcriptional regulator [Oscillospiraceae bacterium]|nr:helix-turn-helix transcriptional regulator [Oscillospiraceae bacterium]